MEVCIMTTPPYSHQQVIFALNSVANAPSGRHGTVEALEAFAREVITKTFANSAVQGLIGEWELVWGPAVHQAPGSTVADNAMYVARNKTPRTEFVVAISGTNPISKYGWIHEDILINPMQDWPYATGLSPQPRISNGTKTGLDVLLNTLKSSLNQSLTDYLGEQVKSAGSQALSVTVTGHSLGGALSPATALALKNMQGETSGWNPDSSADIAVEPTAGPTPGNKDWADYYDKKLGGSTDRLWNKIDIVPHAWQLDMLAQIPGLYEPTIPKSQFVSAATKLAEANSIIAGNMYRIRADVKGLPGKLDPSILLNIADILDILAVLAANNLLDLIGKELDSSVLEIALLKALVDELIQYLTDKLKSGESLAEGELEALKLDSRTKLDAGSEGLFGQFIDFLNFLVQAAYQHTSAYAKLLGTTMFADLYDEIKQEMA
jgi:hypothetical protein